MLDHVDASSRAELRAFLERVSRTMREHAALDDHLPVSASTSFARAKGQVDGILSRYQEPFRLAVVGEFNAGKTALINALLDREGLLLEGVTPTTGTRTELWWGETESGEVLDNAGNTIFEGPLDKVIPYTDQRTESGRSVSGKGARIVLRINADMLRNLVVIDTPGLGANARDDRVTLESLDFADAALLVVNGLQPGGEDSLSLTEKLRTTGRRIQVVVSRLDQATDPDDAMSAVRDLLGDVADGEPLAVVPPAVTRAFRALRAAEAAGDADAEAAARKSLAAGGYDAVRERIEADFITGDVQARRAITTLSGVTKYLTQLKGHAITFTSKVEQDADRVRDEMTAIQRRVRDSLLPKVPYLAQKIDATVDVHVGAFIGDLSDAVVLYIDKLAAGGVRVGLRSLTSVTERQKARLRQQLQREFQEIFPPRHLDITIRQITDSVRTSMAAEWNGVTIDLNQRVAADRFDATGVVRQVAGQVAKVTASLGADLAAFILLLFVPGGVLVDIALLFLFSGAGSLHRSKLPDRIALAQREARLRIRLQRRSLTDQLGRQYRKINDQVAEDLIRRATDESETRQVEHAELLQALARWTAAAEDLQRLMDEADELAGESGRG